MQRGMRGIGVGIALVALLVVAPASALGAAPLRWSAPRTIDAAGLQSISCASVALCVAAVFPDFNESIAYGIASSTSPAGGTADWSLYDGFGSGLTFEAASCPSVTLCVLADQSGSVAVNSHPTGEHWNVIGVDTLNAITGSPARACRCASASTPALMRRRRPRP